MLYFVLNGFLTIWIWRNEAGKVFVGVREGKQKVWPALRWLDVVHVLIRDTKVDATVIREEICSDL